MLKPAKEIEEIGKISGAGSKEKIRSKIAMLSDDAVNLIEAALNPYRTYGVKKVPTPSKFYAVEDSLTPFFELLEALESREITGNAALDRIRSVLERYDYGTVTILEKVLKKDLKAGFSADTVNAVLGKDTVPVYECKLAKKMDEKYKWKFPILVEAKYDGQRCNAFVNANDGTVLYLARSGKEMTHVDGLFDAELIRLAKSLDLVDGVVFDGEVMGRNFTETMNAKGSDGSEYREALKFYLYDYISFKDWHTQVGTVLQAIRSHNLERLILAGDFSKLEKSKGRLCNTQKEAEIAYERFVSLGFEGAILKDPTAVYSWGRNSDWTKWKPIATFDLTIDGFYEGEAGSRLEGTLGGISVSGFDENGNYIKTDVGSGFSDSDRNEFWKNREKYIGAVVEIEADPNLSVKEGSNSFSLRWPIYVRVRALRGEEKE